MTNSLDEWNEQQMNRERVARFREKMKDAGLKQRNVYVHDDDWERVKKYLARLRSKRL